MSNNKVIGKVLRKLEYGVYLVSMGKGQEGNAFTASWLIQISSDPPMVALAVHNKHQSAPLLKEHGSFVVHLLGEGQAAVAQTYYGPAESGYEKLKTAPLSDSPKTGSPIIGGALGYLDCRIVAEHTAGNHTVYFGEVKEASLENDAPILTTSNSKLKYTG